MLKILYDYLAYGKKSKELTKHEKAEIRIRENAYIFSNIRFVAVLYLIMTAMYMADGIISKIFQRQIGILNLTAIIMSIVSSVTILILALVKNPKIEKYCQHITFVYYMILSTAMLLWLTSYVINNSRYLTSIFFGYIILVICPIPILIYDIINCVYLIAGSTIIFTLYGQNMVAGEWTLSYSMILLGFAAMCHVRSSNISGFYHQYKVNEMTKELEKISTTDFLTDLPNRAALNDFLSKDMAEVICFQRVIGVAMIDIDNFKSFNDFYSHIIGDKCLKDIAFAIKEVSEKYGMAAFRYGGEEFLVIDTTSDEEKFKGFCQDLIESVQRLHIFRQDLDSEHEVVTVSCGSALNMIKNLNDYDLALKVADDNLYKSKKNGKNQYTFSKINL